MTEIKPCFNPNCDLSQPVLVRGGIIKDVCWISCRGCGVSGPRAISFKIAITAWNQIAEMQEQMTRMKEECNRLAKFLEVNGQDREYRREAIKDLLRLGRGDE